MMGRYFSRKAAMSSYASVAIVMALSAAGAIATADEIPLAARAPTAQAATAAIHAAAVAIREARAAGNLWLGTARRLMRARAYREAGDNARALAFAGDAEHEARLALNQARVERARYALIALEGTLDPATSAAIRGLLRARYGDGAMRLIREASGR